MLHCVIKDIFLAHIKPVPSFKNPSSAVRDLIKLNV